MTKQEQRYRIMLIGKKDAFYPDRKRFLGKEGTVRNVVEWPGNYISCTFVFDKFIGETSLSFYKILLKKLPPKETYNAAA